MPWAKSADKFLFYPFILSVILKKLILIYVYIIINILISLVLIYILLYVCSDKLIEIMGIK